MIKSIIGRFSLSSIFRGFVIVTAVVAFAAVAVSPQMVTTHAQSGTAAPTGSVTIKGVLQSVDGDKWKVGGVTIKIDGSTSITGNPQIGNEITIIAQQGSDETLVAVTISLIVISGATEPASIPATMSATSEPTTVTPASTMGAPASTAAATLSSVPFVAIIIEGPVQEITINVVVVFGQHIRLKDHDPILTRLKIGDWIHVAGNFDHDDQNQIIVVAVTIIIIEAPQVIIVAPSGGNSSGDNGNQNDKGKHKGDDDD